MVKKYDSTVARIAGNIMAGIAGEVLNACVKNPQDAPKFVEGIVALARMIVIEVERTEPNDGPS